MQNERRWVKWAIALFFLRTLPISPLAAQQLDLIQSLDMARENYPSIKAKAAMTEASESELRATRDAYIPRVTLQHQYTLATSNSLEGGFYPTQGTLSPSGGIRTENISTATYGSFTTALLEWEVLGFGKYSSNNKAAKADLSVAKMDLENEVFQHQVRVADTYLLLLMAEKLTEVQKANEQRARSFSDAVNAAVISELRPEVDGLLAKAEHEKARVLLLQSQQLENIRRLRLAELLGFNNGTDTVQIDSMQFYSLPVNPGINQSSVVGNPILKLQQARIDASNYRSKAIKSNIFPTVSLVAAGWARGSGIDNTDGSFHTDFSSGTRYQVSNYLLGVSARWAITDGFSVWNRAKAFQAIAKQNTETLQASQLQLQRELSEAESQYQVVLEQSQVVQLQLHAAREAYLQARARYDNGLTTLPTYLQSLVGLNQAEADKAITNSNVWRSLLAIALANGDLEIFLSALQ